MSDIVDAAQSASYQLSPAASSKLRRMTRTSGLASENIISRVAIIRSLDEPIPEDYLHDAPAGGGKEIKGLTLLGKRRQASLLIALVCRHTQEPIDAETARSLIRYHWERGISILARDTAGTTVIDWVAKQVAEVSGLQPKMSRDDLAAALGRRYSRWPLEVRRMVANAGRLELGRSLELAARLAEAVEDRHPGARMSESLALEFLRDEWSLNRLGLDGADRELLTQLQYSEQRGLPRANLRARQLAALPYLENLGLVESDNDEVRLTQTARDSGKDLWSLR